jgi:dolichyl-phosphate beta-glucosyltransferase
LYYSPRIPSNLYFYHARLKSGNSHFEINNIVQGIKSMAYENYEKWKNEPLADDPYLSIIIPTYNEEVRIVPTIGAIASYVSDQGFPWELLIADDGSRDGTVTAVESLGFANLHVLKAEKNGGKGSAVQRGMLAAKGKYVLFADADNSTPIEEINKLLRQLESNQYQVAVGSRALADSQEANRSLLRRVLSGGLRWIVKNVFRIGVRDTQCGFKMYNREAARRLHETQTLMGFSFDLEILYLAAKLGYKVAEVPVDWVDSPGSKVDTRKEVTRFLRDLMKIKLNDLRGRYAQA